MTLFTDTRAAFDAEAAAAGDPAAVERLRVKYLGSKGLLVELRKGVDFSKLAPEEKKGFGQGFNELKAWMEAEVARLGEATAAARVLRPDFDLGLPGAGAHLGAIHPILATQMEVEDIVRSMGFTVFTGDEVVTEFENFDALNIPGDHPARDMQDTFWMKNGKVLRTHTSAMQNRAMRELGVPLRAIFPGRCFRNEAVDITHENSFYQLEGMLIDEHITVANLIAVMRELLARVFAREVKVRLRPGFFPFVEPGFELDFWTTLNGKDRWLELIPCGMIHPEVLRHGGVDPERHSGFAFGLGLTRLAMLKYGIQDIRWFNKGDLRFAEQFRATA